MTTYNDRFTGDVVQPTDVSQDQIDLSAANTTFTWPVPRIVDVIGAAGAFNVIMPDALQASVGQDVFFNNLSAGSFSILANDGITVIETLTSGQSKYVYLRDNTTANGSWGSVVMGGTVSAATAAALQGMGVFAIGTTLNAAINVSQVTLGFTVSQLTDRAKLFVWNGAGGTIALPPAVTAGANFFFMLRNDGSGTLTVDPSGAETINNGLTFNMPQGGNSAIIVCDGTEWFTVGYGQNVNFSYSSVTVSVFGVVGTVSLASLGWNGQPFITLSASTSGTITLTLPDAAGLYIVRNTADLGAGTVTITTTTGTGYTFISGAGSETMVLFSDGANIYPALDPTPIEVQNAALSYTDSRFLEAEANSISYAVALG